MKQTNSDLVSSCSQQKAQPKGREKVAAQAGHSWRRVASGAAGVSTRWCVHLRASPIRWVSGGCVEVTSFATHCVAWLPIHRLSSAMTLLCLQHTLSVTNGYCLEYSCAAVQNEVHILFHRQACVLSKRKFPLSFCQSFSVEAPCILHALPSQTVFDFFFQQKSTGYLSYMDSFTSQTKQCTGLFPFVA